VVPIVTSDLTCFRLQIPYGTTDGLSAPSDRSTEEAVRLFCYGLGLNLSSVHDPIAARDHFLGSRYLGCLQLKLPTPAVS
jgi:hypothetical protein